MKRPIPILILAVLIAVVGCATKSTVETRKAEREAAYQQLDPGQRKLVDEGQIAVGMNEDAVFIAWGKPEQVLYAEDATGKRTTWLYQGTTTDEYITWRYYEVPGPRGSYLARRLDRDVNVREYISAELEFRDNQLVSWRTLPRPGGNTVFGGGGLP